MFPGGQHIESLLVDPPRLARCLTALHLWFLNIQIRQGLRFFALMGHGIAEIHSSQHLPSRHLVDAVRPASFGHVLARSAVNGCQTNFHGRFRLKANSHT